MPQSIGNGAGAPQLSSNRLTRAGSLSPAVLSLVKLAVIGLIHTPLSYAAPILTQAVSVAGHNHSEDGGEDVNLWLYLGVAAALVLLGGAFAGLTIALMGQDEVYLQVIATSGEGSERKSAARVLNLLQKGKHWVLVTLLLSNVITNETLPIVLDRSLGGGWPAVLGSTVLIVIFGEIVPQSICVRYGLPIGAFMAPFVLALMWIMAPVAWPTAKLLDWLLGEDHGTTYKKAGLKTLVTLHKTLGTVPGERLNEDEVTIITAVLDLKDKPVGAIMTPMEDVFTMSAETVLDEAMMDTILSQGYSRIPIYAPENPQNFIGMLLVKILITYDPEDCWKVRDFALATLPETAPDTSCLDIVNFFQEGKSHMVLVSDYPGEDRGANGVVTLEDVIEELIGEEIIDESDVFVDVHKAIRRMAPAPATRYMKSSYIEDAPSGHNAENSDQNDATEDTHLLNNSSGRGPSANGARERRPSSVISAKAPVKPPTGRANTTADLRQHLKHLGPSNVASRPKATKYSAVKIKPGVNTVPESLRHRPRSLIDGESQRTQSICSTNAPGALPGTGGVGAGLLEDAGNDAKHGALAVAHGYGTMASPTKDSKHTNGKTENATDGSNNLPTKSMTAGEAAAFADEHTAAHLEEEERKEPELPEKLIVEGGSSRPVSKEGQDHSDSSPEDTVGEMEASQPKSRSSRTARSGSISETIVNIGGMKKTVLETNSSDADQAMQAISQRPQTDGANDEQVAAQDGDKGGSKRKKKKQRAGKKFRNKDSSRSGSGDSTPLLNQDDE